VTFEAGDGATAHGRWFAPAGTAWGSVALATGVGIPQRFYKRAAGHLARAGLATLTFDYRGVGEGRPNDAGGKPVSLRGRPETLLDWALYDHAGALAEAARRAPNQPRFSVCHSFGGQSLGLVPGAESLNAAIIVAAASGDLKHWPTAARLRFQAQMGLMVPTLTAVLGRVPGRLMGGEDLPPKVARQWARWTLTPGYLAGAVPERMAHGRLDFPIHIYSATDDALGPVAAVDELASWYSAAQVTRHAITPRSLDRKALGHSGLFRVHARRLWDRWIEQLRAAANAQA
jgi:predicted alpha/beta hydrolase